MKNVTFCFVDFTKSRLCSLYSLPWWDNRGWKRISLTVDESHDCRESRGGELKGAAWHESSCVGRDASLWMKQSDVAATWTVRRTIARPPTTIKMDLANRCQSMLNPITCNQVTCDMSQKYTSAQNAVVVNNSASILKESLAWNAKCFVLTLCITGGLQALFGNWIFPNEKPARRCTQWWACETRDLLSVVQVFSIITKTTQFPPMRVGTIGRLPNSIKGTAAICTTLNQNIMIVKYSPCCSQLPWF